MHYDNKDHFSSPVGYNLFPWQEEFAGIKQCYWLPIFNHMVQADLIDLCIKERRKEQSGFTYGLRVICSYAFFLKLQRPRLHAYH